MFLKHGFISNARVDRNCKILPQAFKCRGYSCDEKKVIYEREPNQKQWLTATDLGILVPEQKLHRK